MHSHSSPRLKPGASWEPSGEHLGGGRVVEVVQGANQGFDAEPAEHDIARRAKKPPDTLQAPLLAWMILNAAMVMVDS